MEKLTLKVAEVAQLMGISIPKAYDLTKIEGFPVLQLGRRLIIPRGAFLRWIEETAKAPKVV